MKAFFSLLFLIVTSALISQNADGRLYKIGKAAPDYRFEDIASPKFQSASISSFRGRWLIVDCWNRYCSNCVKKMPFLDSIQRENRDSLQVLLVGYTGSFYTGNSDDREIRKLSEKLRENLNLSVPIAFDSIFFDRVGIGACPFILIIDPVGSVRTITSYFTRTDLLAIMNDRQPALKPVTYRRNEAAP